MGATGLSDARVKMAEIDELIKNYARQYQEGNQRTAAIAKGQINRCLEKRRGLLRSLGKKIPTNDELARVSGVVVHSSSVLI